MFTKVKSTYNEFPSKFWVLFSATLVDRIGGTMAFPFFALYITGKFDVGMTQAGILLGIFSISSLFGGMLGGALTDRIGRKKILLFGLVFSAVSSVSLGLATELWMFYPLVVVVGLLANSAGPAQQAMVADLVPEEKRSEGYGFIRIATNLGWVLGPVIGGFVAQYGFIYAFVGDAIASIITGVIVLLALQETKPVVEGGVKESSFMETLGNYRFVLKDRTFMSFLLVMMLMTLVYIQMYNTLGVFLRDVHGIAPRGYGALMSMNAFTVVLAQFWVTKQTSKHAPMLMMALGAGLYVIGFTMYGFVATYVWFGIAMLVITFGEMVTLPVAQTVIAKLAPIDMRGRYMAVYGLQWAIPSAIGPTSAGYLLDNFNPNLVWFVGGVIVAVSALGFIFLHTRTHQTLQQTPTESELDAVPHEAAAQVDSVGA